LRVINITVEHKENVKYRMTQKISEDKKKEAVNLYEKGFAVKGLSQTYHVSQSSVYHWIKQYAEHPLYSGRKISSRQVFLLEKEIQLLQTENQIFRKYGCSMNSSVAEKLKAMERLHDEFSVHALSRVLQVRRSTFYHYLFRRPEKSMIQQEDEILKPAIQAIFGKSKERFGSQKIKVKLKELGLTVSLGRIRRLMKEMNLVCKQVQLRYFSTTNRKYKYYRNRVQQKFLQEAPNLVWVSDVTYIRVREDFHAICVVIDLFSRKVLSYSIARNNDTELITATFDKAFNSRNRPDGLLFHSDQGVQYTAFEFRRYLRTIKVKQSFSSPGTPYDNAVAESFFATMKREELSHNYYDRIEDLHRDVAEYISFFNDERPHQKLGLTTPTFIEEQFFASKK